MSHCIHGVPLYDCCPECLPAPSEDVPPFLPPPHVPEDVASAIKRLEAELARTTAQPGGEG